MWKQAGDSGVRSLAACCSLGGILVQIETSNPQSDHRVKDNRLSGNTDGAAPPDHPRFVNIVTPRGHVAGNSAVEDTIRALNPVPVRQANVRTSQSAGKLASRQI